MLDLGRRDRLIAGAARQAAAEARPLLVSLYPGQHPGHELGSHNRRDAVRFRDDLDWRLGRIAQPPDPAVAMDQRFAVTPDRVVRSYQAGANGAHDLGAVDMMDAAIRPEDDILAGHDAHPTRCAAR